MDTASKLLRRLRDLECPDLDLDQRIWALINTGSIYGPANYVAPRYTASLDRAMDLIDCILPGAYSLEMSADPSGCGARLIHWPEGLGAGVEVRFEELGIDLKWVVLGVFLQAYEKVQNAVFIEGHFTDRVNRGDRPVDWGPDCPSK